MKRAGAIGLVVIAAWIGGCGTTGDYIWVDSVPNAMASPPEGDYVIGIGDTVNVRVWNQESMSTRAKVRPDGKITMPLLNDVDVEGVEPMTLARRLQVKLTSVVVNPVVTVSIEERSPLQVSVVGEVARPGQYQVDPHAGVVQALALAGGLTEYAARDRIFVLRAGYWASGTGSGAPARIRFRYRRLLRAEGKAASFRLRTGDVVIVE